MSRYLLILMAILLVGCTRTQYKTKKTGLFGDDLISLMENFKKIENGKTGRTQLENLGFKTTADNVETFIGVNAFKEVYGVDSFRYSDPERLAKLLPEFNRYTLIRIPFQDIRIKTDRWYFSEKSSIKTGDDVALSVVLYDDMVVYHAPQYIKINEKEVDSAFAQGLMNILENVSVIPKIIDLFKK